jgi:hypothetical protein
MRPRQQLGGLPQPCPPAQLSGSSVLVAGVLGGQQVETLLARRPLPAAGRQVGGQGEDSDWSCCYMCGKHCTPQKALQALPGPELGPLPHKCCTATVPLPLINRPLT